MIAYEESKQKNYLYDKFGIISNQLYLIIFTDSQNSEYIVQGEVLNFNTIQLVIKSKKGLYIIKRSRVIEMRPIMSFEGIEYYEL